MLEPWALANSAWKKKVFWWLIEEPNLRTARCLHALSSQEAQSFRRLGLNNPIAIVPNGVSVPDVPVEVGAFRTRFPAVGDRRVLLFLGRIHPKKGLANLFDAWKSIVTKDSEYRKNWVLVVAGPDQRGHAAALQARAEHLGIGNDVIFTGALAGDRKSEAFAASAAFVLPSFSEGFSMAALEAMSQGLPVLLSNQCNFDVAALGAGWVCEPTVESIASSLRQVVGATDSGRRTLGERARHVVQTQYTWEIAGRRLLDVYHWLLGGGAPPDAVRLE
jgi:poly(glycerol-phosphate) alpha-glucosyltransferase